MQVRVDLDDQDLQDWFGSFDRFLNDNMVRAVNETITAAESFMRGPEVLGKWPTPHADVYPPPPGQGEVPGRYWSAPGTVPTRVTERLFNSIRQSNTHVSGGPGFRTYERGVGPQIWYALKQEHGFYSPRLRHGVTARPFLLPTLDWLDTSGTVDRLFSDAVDRVLR